MLIGIQALGGSDAQARVLQGIITGMGFIGGGAILKRDHSVSGTATATSLWTTGAIGAAVAWQRLEIAIVLSILTFVTMQFGRSVKPVVADNGESSRGSHVSGKESRPDE
jgi:putative Mg2+ transporter-C (MgtC) family protein